MFGGPELGRYIFQSVSDWNVVVIELNIHKRANTLYNFIGVFILRGQDAFDFWTITPSILFLIIDVLISLRKFVSLIQDLRFKKMFFYLKWIYSLFELYTLFLQIFITLWNKFQRFDQWLDFLIEQSSRLLSLLFGKVLRKSFNCSSSNDILKRY